ILNHPNIVTIYGVGEESDIAFMAMELVEGRTLRVLLDEQRLSTKTTLFYAQQLAEALAVAHERRIVHGDLKPENIMITPSGLVKILDFGLAKQHDPLLAVADVNSGSDGKSPGPLLGTVGYMSPEQATGEMVTPASDQFSFGAILYEMLSGHRAFA